jgi:hypothetical protein
VEREGVVEQVFEIFSSGLGWLLILVSVLGGGAAIGLSGLLIAVLNDPKSYDLIAGWMGERRRVVYRRWLGRADAGLRGFFGRRMLGWRAFERCLLLAYLYPVFLLLVAWVFGASLTLGGDPLFEGDWRWGHKTLAVTSLAILLGIAYKHEIFASWIRSALPRKIGQHPFAVIASRLFVIYAAAAVAFAVAFAVAVAGAFAGAFAFAFAFAVAGAFAFAFAVAGAFAFAVAGAFAGAFAGAGAVAFAGAFAGAAAVAIFLLYVFLPIANAAMDWLSWAVSRRLLADLVQRGANAGVGAILWHAAADLIAALVLLAGLAFLLPFVLQGTNLVFDWPAIEWWDYLAAARRAPFGEGLFVTGMLFSTLLPTAVHFLILMFALLFPQPVWLRARWLDWLTAPEPALIQKLGVVGVFTVSVAASWGLLVLFGFTVYAVLLAFGADLGTLLAELALWAGGLVGPALPPGAGLP